MDFEDKNRKLVTACGLVSSLWFGCLILFWAANDISDISEEVSDDSRATQITIFSFVIGGGFLHIFTPLLLVTFRDRLDWKVTIGCAILSGLVQLGIFGGCFLAGELFSRSEPYYSNLLFFTLMMILWKFAEVCGCTIVLVIRALQNKHQSPTERTN